MGPGPPDVTGYRKFGASSSTSSFLLSSSLLLPPPVTYTSTASCPDACLVNCLELSYRCNHAYALNSVSPGRPSFNSAKKISSVPFTVFPFTHPFFPFLFFSNELVIDSL